MRKHVCRIAASLLGAGMFCGSLSAGTAYFETNLASDIPGLAANLDPNLKNPWGMSFSATSPFWVSNQGSNNATLYNGAGVPQALVVSTPSGIPPGPTGQVFGNVAGNFLLPIGTGAAPAPATFIFDTLGGKIAGWNGAQGNPVGTAATEFTATDGAVFTGLAINSAAPDLYAADFANGRIDVFNGLFAPTALAGTFTDPTLPAGYSPYNIQNIGGKLYVEYAKVNVATGMPTTTANTGIVSVFNLDGTFSQRLATNTHLNSPWGVTQAPAGFGSFGGDILVGNFGDGTISAFNPTTLLFDGTLSGQSGNPIVNGGLWALNFRAVGSGFDPNTLFLDAGINGEADGLFAEIQIVPEPSTFLMLALAAIPIAWRKARTQSEPRP
jgi:uncharacterized protein (TIGR03118 family)